MRKLLILDVAGFLLAVFLLYQGIVSILVGGNVQLFWTVEGFFLFLITANNVSRSDIHHKNPILVRRLASAIANLYTVTVLGYVVIGMLVNIVGDPLGLFDEGILTGLISIGIGIIVAVATFFNRPKE